MSDLIDRAQAIAMVKGITNWHQKTYHETRPTAESIIDGLRQLQTITPQVCVAKVEIDSVELTKIVNDTLVKELRVLADCLDGTPLLYPCNLLWEPEGWCKDHCGDRQSEPDAECWLKYAEARINDRLE